MPRLQGGYWAAGVGGGIASVGKWPDLAPIAQWDNAGGTCWLQPGLAIFQHGAHLESFNVQTGEHNERFDAQGCFSLAAGGGVYAATFYDGARVSNQGPVRYYGYGIADVSPDGIPVLLQPNGRLDAAPPDDQVFAAGSIQVLAGGAFYALDKNYRPYAGNGAKGAVALPGRVYGFRVHGDLCCYHAEQGGHLVIQKRDALTGVIVASGLLECHRPDFEEVNGVIRIIYATKEGEAPWQLVALQTDRSKFAPLPVPQPKPEPVPVIDYLAIIKDVRKKYGTPLGADHWKFLVEVAQRTGTQLFKKNGGAHVLIPSLGVNVSSDIIGRGTLANQWADILLDSEGEARPIFNIGDGPAGGEYLDVAHVVIDGVPPPTLSLEQRIAALEQRVHALDGK